MKQNTCTHCQKPIKSNLDRHQRVCLSNPQIRQGLIDHIRSIAKDGVYPTQREYARTRPKTLPSTSSIFFNGFTWSQLRYHLELTDLRPKGVWIDDEIRTIAVNEIRRLHSEHGSLSIEKYNQLRGKGTPSASTIIETFGSWRRFIGVALSKEQPWEAAGLSLDEWNIRDYLERPEQHPQHRSRQQPKRTRQPAKPTRPDIQHTTIPDDDRWYDHVETEKRCKWPYPGLAVAQINHYRNGQTGYILK